MVLAFGLAFSSGGNIVSAQTIQEPEIIITESDEDSIVVSEGTSYEISTDQSGNTVITWTISGNPYEELTMQYQLNLKPNEDGTYPTGDFDTNEGYTTINDGSTIVNQVDTPVLSRPGEETTPPTEEPESNKEDTTTPTSSTESSEGIKTSTKTNQNLMLACLILSCWLLTMLIVTREEKKRSI